MIFTSLKFLLFVSVVIAVYFVFPKKYRWIWLLAASYFFYLSASLKYGIFLVFSTALTYAAALFMEWLSKRSSFEELPGDERKAARKKLNRQKKYVVVAAILINFGILFFIKYYNFAANSLAALSGALGITFSPHLLSFALPVGISFYTFR